jgi:antitoxin MazE
MRVAKWGNSLGVRLPVSVVEVLDIKEGDEVIVRAGEERELVIERDRRRERALEAIRKLQRPLPPDFKFDRNEANER